MAADSPVRREPDGPKAGGMSARVMLGNVARLRELVTFLIVVAVIVLFHVKTLPPIVNWCPRCEKALSDQDMRDGMCQRHGVAVQRIPSPDAPRPSVFLSGSNLRAMLVGLTSEAILVVGMTIVIVGGGFDISVGSVLALAGLVTVQVAKLGVPLPLAILAGLLTGAVCGAANGLLVARLGMSPLIATLGMMMAARGLVTVHVQRYGATSSTDLPGSFLALGQGRVWGTQGFWVVLIALVVVAVGELLLRNLRWLRQAYYIGGNERAAALSGINVARVRTVTYILCGITAAVAGILNSARFGTATSEAGTGLELFVIAECVIGGASLVGGQGSVLGAFLGVVLVNCVKNGLSQLGVPPDWQYVVVGAALIAFVTVDIVLAKRRRG